MNNKNFNRLILVSLASALIFDQLFWKRTPGISILIFVLVYLSGLIYITLSEGQRPPRSSWLLLAPILFFSTFTAVRLEPFTLFICLLMSAVCLLILTMTWLGGSWIRYSLADYILRFFLVLGGLITLGLEKLSKNKAGDPVSENGGNGRFRSFARKYLLPVFFGLVLAVPAVAVLGSILASADPIFNSQMEDFWRRFFDLNIGEIIVRGFYILIIAYATAGAYLFSLEKSNQEKLIGLDQPVIPQRFNWITSATVIASIDLLFAFFVYIQFRYFFGGQANIVTDGFTYAEYARKGFNEILIVAFLSLVIFLGLSTITRRAEGRGRGFYSALGIGLVLLAGVILVSGFQRLELYEAAYGFSRIRTYSHVFMVWLGALLAVTVILEIANRLRYFALACLLTAMGFGLTLTLLNVDGFILRQNLARSSAGEELDIPYLVSLSDDAFPDLIRIYQNAQTESKLENQALAVIACRDRNFLKTPPPDNWQSFHFSHEAAARLNREVKEQLPLTEINSWGSGPIIIAGETIICENPADISVSED